MPPSAKARPDELYHLAAPSFVPYSLGADPPRPWRHRRRNGVPAPDGVHAEPSDPHVRRGSGAIFGAAPREPAAREHQLSPAGSLCDREARRAPAGGSDATRHDGLFACSGILYNHESERRPGALRLAQDHPRRCRDQARLADPSSSLGDSNAVRDWSFAGDIVHGAWLALQRDQPDDYILASGVPHTVGELAELAFAHVGLSADELRARRSGAWSGPAEPTPLGRGPGARPETLGWRPALDFEQLIGRMVEETGRRWRVSSVLCRRSGRR